MIMAFLLVLRVKRLRDHLEGLKILAKCLEESLANRRSNRLPSKRLSSSRKPIRIPLESDLVCQGERGAQDRNCRIRNLCYSAKRDRFFILHGPGSFFYPPELAKAHLDGTFVLDLTTVDNHNVFHWSYDEAPTDFFTRLLPKLRIRTVDLNHQVNPLAFATSAKAATTTTTTITNLTLVRGTVQLFKRFFPVNIMHVIHDDWLGLFALRDQWPSLRRGVPLVAIDHSPSAPYDEIYQWLGPLYTIEELLGLRGWKKRRADRPEAYVCFEDAIIGNSKELSWYQYGWGKPQGPIPGKSISGSRIRIAAWHVLRRLGIRPWVKDLIQDTMNQILSDAPPIRGKQSSKPPCIAIFARRANRLIRNEKQLATALQTSLGLPICWIRLEDHSLPQLIADLRRAIAAFGMHGSILVLAMFLPPGAVLVEGFPYGVPPENYTPYRTLAHLPGLKLAYRTWTPTDPQASIGYPERPAREGGLMHLSEEQRNFIKNATTIPPHPCCDNPHWLYRIFQDTTVDANAIVGLIKDGLREGSRQYNNSHGLA